MAERSMTVFDVTACARCGGAHGQLEFQPLTMTIGLLGKPAITHWAPCPSNGEPILLAFVEKGEDDESAREEG